MNLFEVNSLIYATLNITNIVLYLKAFRKYKESWLLLIAMYLITMLLGHASSILCMYVFDQNIIVYHLFTYAQIILLSSFYKSITSDNKLKKRINYSLLLCLFCITLQFAMWPHKLTTFNVLEVFLFNYAIIIWGLIYSYKNLAFKPKHNIVNIGLITYCFFTISILTYGNYLVQVEVERAQKIWMLNDYNNLFLQFMILAQFIHYNRNKLWTNTIV